MECETLGSYPTREEDSLRHLVQLPEEGLVIHHVSGSLDDLGLCFCLKYSLPPPFHWVKTFPGSSDAEHGSGICLSSHGRWSECLAH